MLNGNGSLDTSTHRLFGRVRSEISSRRLETLIGAVRAHEARASRFATGRRPHDEALYASLREIVGAEGRRA